MTLTLGKLFTYMSLCVRRWCGRYHLSSPCDVNIMLSCHVQNSAGSPRSRVCHLGNRRHGSRRHSSRCSSVAIAAETFTSMTWWRQTVAVILRYLFRFLF